MTKYSLVFHKKIAEINQQQWNTLAQPLKTPFMEWEWLHNLETSGSATVEEGWQPCHLTVFKDKQLVAAAPLYIKTHSYGEFVFDSQWAQLSYRLGIPYYPKMLGMVPFTPATGYRFLIHPQEDEQAITHTMMSAIDTLCQRNQIKGCHFLFVDEQWRLTMEEYGFHSWLHHSYIWQNKGFGNFDDFLSMFNANQRRNIKRERKAVENSGLAIKVLAGEDIPHHLFPLIYGFYSHTCDKFWGGSKYLTRKFFEQLYPNYRHRVVLVLAYSQEDDSKPVGMSFCIRKDEQMYGRYWGSFDEYDCLHFEACYYKPIEWGISHGVKLFDPGAGGQHKKRRGFPATGNYSLHRLYDSRMSQIMAHYMGEINQMEQEEMDAINGELPFTKREINFNI